MSNFIKQHIVKKINEQVKEKQSKLNHHHFFYFDDSIDIGIQTTDRYLRNKKIDRINPWQPFLKEDIIPTTYYALNGPVLIEIWQKLKSNQFFIYKTYDKKSFKVRMKV